MPTVTLRTAVSSFSRAPRVRTRPGHRPGYGGRMVERSEPTFRRMRRRITATKRGHISSNREKKLYTDGRRPLPGAGTWERGNAGAAPYLSAWLVFALLLLRAFPCPSSAGTAPAPQKRD